MRDLWFLKEGFEVGIFLATEDTPLRSGSYAGQAGDTEIPSTLSTALKTGTLRTAFGRLWCSQLRVFSPLRGCDTHSLRPPKFQRPGLRAVRHPLRDLEADQIKNACLLLWGNVSRWQCHIAQESAEIFLTRGLLGDKNPKH